MMQCVRCLMVFSLSATINLSATQILVAQEISKGTQFSTKLTSNQTIQKAAPTSESSLNPDPNLLQLPTKPDEIRLQATQAITLQEAIALAERNNRDLQVAELTLRRSQAALRQARAVLYPTLAGETELGYQRSSQDRLNDLRYLNKDASATGVLGGRVELSYDIFTSGKRPAQIRAAEAQVRFERKSHGYAHRPG